MGHALKVGAQGFEHGRRRLGAVAFVEVGQQTDRYVLQAHGSTLGAHAQMWLTLARALDAAGVLSADALAQQLERHAQRAPEDPGWFYTLLEVAQLLREPSSNHPDSRLR